MWIQTSETEIRLDFFDELCYNKISTYREDIHNDRNVKGKAVASSFG